MKKYITPTIECYQVEIHQIIAASNPERTTMSVASEDADLNYDGGGDARENNNSNMWESGW